MIDLVFIILACVIAVMASWSFRRSSSDVSSGEFVTPTDAPTVTISAVPIVVVAVSPASLTPTPESSITIASPTIQTPTLVPSPTELPQTTRAVVPSRSTAQTGPNTGVVENSLVRYRDPSGRFEFAYPATWQIRQSSSANVAVQFISAVPRGNLTITTQNVPVGSTLDQYVAESVKAIERVYPSYHLDAGGTEPTVIGGVPARRYVFRGMQGETPIQLAQIVLNKDNVTYVFTLTSAEDASDAYAAQVDLGLRTFVLRA